jgi:hypothetical protein
MRSCATTSDSRSIFGPSARARKCRSSTPRPRQPTVMVAKAFLTVSTPTTSPVCGRSTSMVEQGLGRPLGGSIDKLRLAGYAPPSTRLEDCLRLYVKIYLETADAH